MENITKSEGNQFKNEFSKIKPSISDNAVVAFRATAVANVEDFVEDDFRGLFKLFAVIAKYTFET